MAHPNFEVSRCRAECLVALQTYVSPDVDRANCRSTGGNNSQGAIYKVPVSIPLSCRSMLILASMLAATCSRQQHMCMCRSLLSCPASPIAITYPLAGSCSVISPSKCQVQSDICSVVTYVVSAMCRMQWVPSVCPPCPLPLSPGLEVPRGPAWPPSQACRDLEPTSSKTLLVMPHPCPLSHNGTCHTSLHRLLGKESVQQLQFVGQ